MSKSKPARPLRALSFRSADEVMPEVDRLLEGHETLGNWTLGQILSHVGGSFGMLVHGPPMMFPWVFRRTLGAYAIRDVLAKGAMPAGLWAPRAFQPTPGADARVEAEALRSTLAACAAHTGPVPEHPVGGRLTRERWDRLQLIHAAHHIRFAAPTTAGRP